MTDILTHTFGRATNDNLERTTAVWFKCEDYDDHGNAYGPIYLAVEGEDNLVPYRLGEDAEWHRDSLAEELADLLGVKVKWS